MDISVVVPTYNRQAIVQRTLATLFAQNIPASAYEVIVVVDGSTDGTAEALKLLRPPCTFRVIGQENRGPAAARNAGYGAAAADVVLFLDDDMMCDPGLVAAHVAAHLDGDSIVAFGAVFLSADSPRSLASECFNREIGALHLRQKFGDGAPWQVNDCIFSNASLPRGMLIDAGGFDEAFRMREDLELGVRLLQAGAQPRSIKNAIAYQYYNQTVTDLLADAEAFAVADVLFTRKHPEARIPGHLRWLEEEPRWKQRLRRFAAGSPAFENWLLAPLCRLGERYFHVAALRNVGVRALQARRRMHWLRVVRRLTEES